MKCRSWIERLPSLLDEDPRSPGRRQLEAHIGQCQACRGQWSLLARIKAEAGQLGGLEPGDEVWEGIEGELAGREPEKPSREVKRGPMLRLALGWGACLAVALVAVVYLWPRPRGASDPQAVNIGPAETASEASDARTAGAIDPAPIRLAKKSVPSPGPEGPPHSETRYLADDLASAEDLAEPEPRVRYIMPMLAPADLGNAGSGQQYIMPAVCSTAREPF